MSASKSYANLTPKRRRLIKRLQRRAHRQYGVLSQIEKGLKGRYIFPSGLPSDVVELHAVFGYAGSGDGLGYYTELTLRYRLETEDWWLIKKQYYGRGYVTSAVPSWDPSFWRSVRGIPSEDMTNAKVEWGMIV